MLTHAIDYTHHEPAQTVIDIRVDAGTIYDSQTIISGETVDGRAFLGRISNGACVIIVNKVSAKHFIGLARRTGLAVSQ